MIISTREREVAKMKYTVLVQAETIYEVEAENEQEAEEIALEWFLDYEPYIEVTEGWNEN